MARKKNTETPVDAADIDTRYEAVPPSPSPAKRGRPAGKKAAKGRPARPGKTVVVLPAETVDLVRDVAERLERPIAWVINRLVVANMAELNALSGTDFTAAADAAGLR